MKRLIFIACFFCTLTGNAQTNNNSTAHNNTRTSNAAQSTSPVYIYGEVGGGGGTGNSTTLALNVLFLEDNIASVGIYSYTHRALNIPRDYDPGYGLLGDRSLPVYSMSMMTFMYGKMLFIPDIKHIRFSLKGGLALGTLTQPENFRYVQNNGWLFPGSNYDYDQVRSLQGGLILNPSAEFPLTRGFGLRLGLTSMITTYTTSFQIDGSILFGRLRQGKSRRERRMMRTRMENQNY